MKANKQKSRMPRGSHALMKLIQSDLPEKNSPRYLIGLKRIARNKHYTPVVRDVADGIYTRLAWPLR